MTNEARRDARRPPGRPPGGLNGDRVTGWPRVGTQLPPETLAYLRGLSSAQGLPLWRVLHDLLEAHRAGREAA